MSDCMNITTAPVPMSRYDGIDDVADVGCSLTARDCEILMDGLDLLSLFASSDAKLSDHISSLLAHIEAVIADGSSELEPLEIKGAHHE